MIDVHIHTVPPRLPGSGPLSTLLEEPLARRAAAIRQAMASAKIEHAFAMGELNATPEDPLGVASTFAVMARVPGLSAIGIMDPARDPQDREHFAAVHAALADRRIVALKGYLGYTHYEPSHANYRRYYELAAQHRVPVVFHTGDTYSKLAKLRYAHPLGIDDVAVDHPDCNFVIAHLGNPWTLDAAEVIYKNDNVWADLSGFLVGDASLFEAEDWDETLADVAGRILYAVQYAEKRDRIVYGSDWPLIPMAPYQRFLADVLPDDWHTEVFEENARRLFGRLR
jgi:uncharacterized protein